MYKIPTVWIGRPERNKGVKFLRQSGISSL